MTGFNLPPSKEEDFLIENSRKFRVGQTAIVLTNINQGTEVKNMEYMQWRKNMNGQTLKPTV